MSDPVREQMVQCLPHLPQPPPLPHPYHRSPAVDLELHSERYLEPGRQAPSRWDRRSRRLPLPCFAIVTRQVDEAEACSNGIESFASYRMGAEFGLFALGSASECLQISSTLNRKTFV